MTTPLAPEDFDALLARLFAEGLSDEEQQSLEATIATDAAALARYVEIVHLREGLPYLLGGEATTPGGEGPGGEEYRLAKLFDGGEPLDGTPTNQAASVEPRSRSIAADLGGSARRLPSWAAAASIAFVIGAALAASAYRWAAPSAMLTDRDDAQALRPVTSAPTTPFVQENWLGKVTGLSLEASADGVLEAMQVGQQLRCGEVVQLSQGFMRVELHSGLEFLVEGPAEFSLVSDEGLFLRTGRVAAEGQSRFVVQTPLLTAECLHAEVRFEAADDDSASIYVDAGVATLFTTAQEGVGSEKLSVLHDGEGLLVQSKPSQRGRLTTAMRGPMDHVVRAWSEVENRLSAYQRLVLTDRPAAYWPLHRVRKNRRVLDLTQNGHDGWPIGNWPDELARDAASDSGAYFNGESYVEPDRKPPIDPRTGFAVEGWAKVTGGPEYQSIFTSRWVLRSHQPDCQMFGFTLYAGEGDTWEFWTGSGQRGELWQRLISDSPVRRDQWTHVVATFTPGDKQTADSIEGIVRLFVDGKQVVEGVHRESLTDFEWPARIGAAEFVPRYLTSWLFQGSLRDVAVYDYALADARVAEHFKAGSPSADERTAQQDGRQPLLIAAVTGGRGL